MADEGRWIQNERRGMRVLSSELRSRVEGLWVQNLRIEIVGCLVC
jgi:hypothetical protein